MELHFHSEPRGQKKIKAVLSGSTNASNDLATGTLESIR